MRKLSFFFPLLSLLPFNTVVLAQSGSDNQLREELIASEAILYELEESVSQTDLALLEPLEQVADRLMSLYRFDEAHNILDRAMQIARINDGLYTPAQLPFLRKKIENFANWGDWDSTEKLASHLSWLHTNKLKIANAELVTGLIYLSEIHLRGINEDTLERQGYHFRNAAANSRLALAAAEYIWSENDPRLVPVIYNQLKHFYIQSVAVDKGGRYGYALRATTAAPGRGRILDQATSQRIFYSNGLVLLDRINDIYRDGESANLEGLAMAQLYRADWQVLFNKRIDALESYRKAYLGLVDAGVSNDLINEFFNRPLVLPASKFYQSIAAGMQARLEVSQMENDDSLQNPLFYVAFDERSALFPNIKRPGNLQSVKPFESNFALISFNLTGLQESSLQTDVRDLTALGVVEKAEVLQHSQLGVLHQDELQEKLNWLRFRPKLVDGVPQEASGLLRYLVAADSP